MNAWLRKYESTGFGWGKCHSLSQPYKHIIPRIWRYVNPLYDIFLFNQQLILLPSYLHHK